MAPKEPVVLIRKAIEKEADSLHMKLSYALCESQEKASGG